ERGITIGDIAHHIVDAEDFLNQDDPGALPASRHRQVCFEFTAIERSNRYHNVDLFLRICKLLGFAKPAIVQQRRSGAQLYQNRSDFPSPSETSEVNRPTQNDTSAQ